MNGLYSLRRKDTERDPMEGPLFPNVPGPPLPVSPKAEEISQPDNTMNTLLKLINIAQALKGQPTETGQNALLKTFSTTWNRPTGNQPIKETTLEPIPVVKYGESPSVMAEDIFPKEIPSSPSAALSEPTVTTPTLPKENALYDFYNPPKVDVVPPETISPNALLRATAPVTEKPTNGLLDYWKQPVIGKMPLDQFVQIAGALGGAFGTGRTGIQTPMARVGNVLSQIGGQAYAERIRREREEPTNVLRRQLLEAQIKEAETPKVWDEYKKEYLKNNPNATIREALKAYHEDIKPVTPKEPQYDIDVQQDPTTKEWYHGRRNKTTGVFTADRLATDVEKESKVIGKPSGPPALDFEYKNINGIPHKRQLEWDPVGRQRVPKGDWIRTEKPEKAEKPEKLTMTDVKSAYSMDIGNIKNQMMVDMTPDEQMDVSGQPDVNILALLLAGKVGKSLSPERKKYYVSKLQEVEKYYGDLTNQVLGRKGAKVPEIFKDAQGREIVKDPTSSTGWRFKENPPGLPAGSKIIGKSKKTGNPVYQLPDGSTKEMTR